MGRAIASRPKTKLGCMTCRVRKVKCDEGKPSCFRCTSTGRTCDGYQSLFRHEQRHMVSIKPPEEEEKKEKQVILHPLSSCSFSAKQVAALSANLSAKPPAGGAIGFETEAILVLEASLSSPAVRSALACQNTLRSHLRHHGHITALQSENRMAFAACIDLYNTALSDLSGRITKSGFQMIHSALCCCMLFISVDIMQQDYVSSIHHFASGLKILQSCGGRPALTNGQFEPAQHSGLPAIDIFLLKLFTVPCPFAKQIAEDNEREGGRESSGYLLLKQYQRTLSITASETIDLVAKDLCIQSNSEANRLAKERDSLLESVRGLDVELIRLLSLDDMPPIRRLMTGFQLLYYTIITITLSSILVSSEKTSLMQDNGLNQLVSVADLLRGMAEEVAPDNFVIGACSGIKA